MKDQLYYFNRFDKWEEAEKYCEMGGYSSAFILEKVAKANKEVLLGNALYEQDGIAYTKEHNNYELLFAFFYIYSLEKCLKVCDFGGALGSTYQRYKRILPCDTEWSVVEQPNYVSYGKKNIDEIDFYYSLLECIQNKDINVVLFSGSLQYLPDPLNVLSEASKVAKYILIDETSFQKGDMCDDIYIQHVPSIYYGKEAYYPVRIFDRDRFLDKTSELGLKREFEWLYDGRGTGIPIVDKGQLKETVDRGFLLIK